MFDRLVGYTTFFVKNVDADAENVFKEHVPVFLHRPALAIELLLFLCKLW